jgi:small subunit ribosomal protein S18
MRPQKIQRFKRNTRGKTDTIFSESETVIDYKDERLLSFLTDRLKIIPRRHSGISAKQQRRIKRAIRKARNYGLLPYSLSI